MYDITDTYAILCYCLVLLTLYDPEEGGGLYKPSLRFFALTHLILELYYSALGTFPPKNSLTPCGEKNFDWGS